MPCLPPRISCNTDGCIIKLPSKCVTYDGPATTNIGYITNMPLTDLLVLIDTAIGNNSNSTSYINTTPTILVNGIGSQANPYSLGVRRSTDVGNLLILGSDNALYVAPITPSNIGFNI